MRTPKPMTPCSVTWIDAETLVGAQHESPSAALRAYRPAIRKSFGLWLGWATRDGHEAAALATDDDRSDEEPQAVGGISYIPKGIVVDVLSVASPTKKRSRK